MKLDPAQWSALSALLGKALEMPEPERTAWLDTLAGDDATLAPLLRDLLARHASAESADFLATLPRIDDGEAASAGLDAQAIVGPYRLLRVIGRGGMGEVWLAERVDGLVKRSVALKLPIIAMPQRMLAERFAREREILARLEHPNIARLYDAGVAADGQPYLALEYVEGAPIGAYCDAHELGLRARIALFRKALGAVQFAHANLVLHRDLKPSNILVDTKGEVKLLDFGIAKLLDGGAAAETELTRVGGQALTLDYAAPEQVAGAPLTTAADVYALGVVLYEILCGVRPYRLKRGTRGELEEAIAAVDPAPPSRVAFGETVPATRSTTASRLRRALHGDLDTIVAKALRKDPAARYASAGAMADDLARYESGLPISARPATAWYRTTRFVRRHAVAVSAASIVAVALVAASVLSWIAMEHAKREATIATAMQGFMTDLFRSNSNDQRFDKNLRDMTAPELLDRGAASIEKSLDDAPAAKAALLRLFGEMYEDLGLTQRSLDMHEKSVAAAANVYGESSREYALALLEKAWVAGMLDRRSTAPLAMVEKAKGILAAEAPGSEDYAEALYMEAHLVQSSDITRAVATGEEAVRIIDGLGATDKRAAFARMELGNVYRVQGNLTKATETMRSAIAAFEALYGPDQPDVSFIRNGLAIVLFQQLRMKEAEEYFRTAIGIEEKFPAKRKTSAAFYRMQYAQLLAAQGRYAEAYAEFDAIEKLRTGATDGFSFTAAQVQAMRGVTRLAQGDVGRATEEIKAASADLKAFPPRTVVAVSTLHEFLARSYLAAGDIASARREVDQARESAAKEGVPPVRVLFLSLRDAETAAQEGRAEAALADIDAAVAKAGVGATNADVRSQIALTRARVLLRAGRADDAAGILEPWLGEPLPPGAELSHSVRAEMQLLQGEALLARDPAKARTRLLEAQAALRANDVPGSPRLARVDAALARLPS